MQPNLTYWHWSSIKYSPFQLGLSLRPKILWSTRQKHKGIHPENIKVDTVLIGEGYKG
jgi:hypothetical protein